MNLEKMFKMQNALDERIIKEKGLEGQDLLPNTYVALDTELAEFANEGRGVMEEVPCIKCGKITDADITMCCDGRECGCMGLPIHPPLCEECEKTFFKGDAE